ncbi:MAG: GTP-binding protein [Gloeobacterales cyanobacterium]
MATTLDNIDRGLPVTIITGFLGSGKTTLVNHILTNNQGVKTAVIVNEFGDIGIDSSLIVSTEENMIELDNGCLCCTVREDLVQATLQIMERSDKIEHLIVETTGLADPLPVAMTFMSPELRPLTRLDAIVGMVDAENFVLDLFNSDTATNQISYSDIILLNKTDCVSPEKLQQLERQIRELKAEAPILHTKNAQVDLRLILDVGAFKPEKYDDEAVEEAEHDHTHSSHDHDEHGNCIQDHHDHDEHHEPVDHSTHDHDEHGNCIHDHTQHNHIENEGFTSVSMTIADTPLSATALENFLKDLPEGVFRGKGILWLKESPEKVIFHLVGARIRLDPEPWGKEKPMSQLVFIGKDFDKEEIKAGLLKCISKAKVKPRGFGF